MSNPWLRVYVPVPDARLRLLCFPQVGGSASFYRGWAAPLAEAGVELLGVQYPGRENRMAEPPHTDMASLVDAFVAAFDVAGPIAVFGHSMGASIAHEVTRRLDGVTRLIVSGREAPHLHEPSEPAAYELPDADLVTLLRSLGGTPSAVWDEPELRDLLLPVIRADYALIERYLPAPHAPMAVPVTAITGDADPYVTPVEAAAWSRVTTGEFRLVVLPGDHFYLLPQQGAVLTEITREPSWT